MHISGLSTFWIATTSTTDRYQRIYAQLLRTALTCQTCQSERQPTNSIKLQYMVIKTRVLRAHLPVYLGMVCQFAQRWPKPTLLRDEAFQWNAWSWILTFNKRTAVSPSQLCICSRYFLFESHRISCCSLHVHGGKINALESVAS